MINPVEDRLIALIDARARRHAREADEVEAKLVSTIAMLTAAAEPKRRRIVVLS